MKKTSFLVLLCSFWLFSFAQPGSFFISSSNNQRFWLFIDDVLQNEYSVPSINVQGMRSQQYKIRVEFDNLNANCVGQLITINNYGDNTYSIFGRNNSYYISKGATNMRPALTQHLIQPNYQYYNDYYQYLYPGFGNPGNYWQGSGGNHGKPYQYYQQSNNGWNHGNNQHGGGGPPKPPQPPQPPHQGDVHPPHGNISPCRNATEFSIAMNNLRRESFESGKLQFAKSMTQSGPICVEQIIQVCNAFDFESSKLEYAKFAYSYCSDKNLYYMVSAVFDFQASKDELNKYIR